MEPSTIPDHLPRNVALILRFEGSIAHTLPWPDELHSGILLARDDCNLGEDDADEHGTPTPSRPSARLCFALCDQIRFGSREERIEVRLPSTGGISRLHFSIRFVGNSNLWMVQCHSRNGVVVNRVVLDNLTLPFWTLNPLETNTIVAAYTRIEATVFGRPWTEDAIFRYARASRRSPPDTLEAWRRSESGDANTSSSSTASLVQWLKDCDADDNPSKYIVLCQPEWRLPWSPNAWIAIHAPTARAHAATRFLEHDRDNLRAFYVRCRILKHPNLMSLVTIETDQKRDPLPIQECAPAVCSLDRGLSLHHAAAATRQMVDLLNYLYQEGVCHGCIQGNFITYPAVADNPEGTFQVKLNGLWLRWFQQQSRRLAGHDSPRNMQPTDSDFRQDINAAGGALARALSITDPFMPPRDDGVVDLSQLDTPHDPLLHKVLHLMTGTNGGSVSDLHEYLTQFCAGNDAPPFLETTLTRETTVIVQRRNEILLLTNDLVVLWERMIRYGVFRSTSSQRHLETLDELRAYSADFMPRKRFQAMVRVYGDHLLQLRTALHDLPTSSAKELSIRHSLPIPWLHICGMVNLTRLLEITGTRFDEEIPAECTIEVRGWERHEGLYVDIDWFRQREGMEIICAQLTLPPPSTMTEQARRLKSYGHTDHVLFSTELPWTSIVVFKRSDLQAMWEPFCERQLGSDQAPEWLTLEQSIVMCQDHGLVKLQAAIEQFSKSRAKAAPKSYVLEDLHGRRPQYSYGSDTSVATDSGDDQLAFKRRRR